MTSLKHYQQDSEELEGQDNDLSQTLAIPTSLRAIASLIQVG
jgi:hypothetical protein